MSLRVYTKRVSMIHSIYGHIKMSICELQIIQISVKLKAMKKEAYVRLDGECVNENRVSALDVIQT